ncbi:MAG: hypothetical protein ACOYNY_18860 [Caldilineaceae bacterium]|jgi:hypothetical protein
MQSIGSTLVGDELSPRERTIAELAAKISANPRLTNGARLDHLRAHNLEEEEINTVLKLATVFNYWRARNHLAEPPPQPAVPRGQLQIVLEGEPPYYFEGTIPPTVEGR